MVNSQELAISIKQEAKSRKIPIGKMLSECGLSVNALSSMQSGGYFPRLEAIVKIADYLECSVDYLLGRAEIPSNIKKTVPQTFTPEEINLVMAYRQAESDDKSIVDLSLNKYMVCDTQADVVEKDGVIHIYPKK